jgi:dihydroorotase
MFGSDSAPHPQDAKESSHCSAGVFTAPIALQLLAELFETNDVSFDNLQKFVSDNAKNIYGINPKEQVVILEKTPFIVPKSYGKVVPMYAGETISWSLVD